MSRSERIEQELTKAAKGLQNGNDGLARVCARRAVALASQHRANQRNLPNWQGDAMHHLRQIQEETTFPLHVRAAAQRLLTKVTEQTQLPMTTDPITDARIILDHLNAEI
ncbi:MAG TPA: hypothetical protein PKK23_18255 [Nitrospirales bacterium]|nr:hypothetical protein [Nitrospiraceae bacterium]HNP30993.1 hypothetical protein [Nitrospirales bacterium]